MELAADMRTQEELYDAKGERIFTQDEVKPTASNLAGVDSKNTIITMWPETQEEELMHTVFSHPILSEMMHESVLDAYGRVIHM